MSTETRRINVSGVPVLVVRKPIKHLHLGVYPPSGRVRVAAPLRVSDDAVRLAVVSRLGWIRRQQRKFAAQPRQPRREMIGGESHYVFGRRHRLRLAGNGHLGTIRLRANAILELVVVSRTNRSRREHMVA